MFNSENKETNALPTKFYFRKISLFFFWKCYFIVLNLLDHFSYTLLFSKPTPILPELWPSHMA